MTEDERAGSKISLERARALLDDPTVSDEELIKIIEDLKMLCGIIYDVYRHKKEMQNGQPEKPKTGFSDEEVKDVA